MREKSKDDSTLRAPRHSLRLRPPCVEHVLRGLAHMLRFPNANHSFLAVAFSPAINKPTAQCSGLDLLSFGIVNRPLSQSHDTVLLQASWREIS